MRNNKHNVRKLIKHFSYNIGYINNFTIEKMFKDFKGYIQKNVEYTVISRISYVNKTTNHASQYRMLDRKQEVINVSKLNELKPRLDKYIEGLKTRLENSMEIYKYNDSDIIEIMVSLYTTSTKPKPKKDTPITYNSSKLGYNKTLINQKDFNIEAWLVPYKPVYPYNKWLGKEATTVIHEDKLFLIIDDTRYDIVSMINSLVVKENKKDMGYYKNMKFFVKYKNKAIYILALSSSTGNFTSLPSSKETLSIEVININGSKIQEIEYRKNNEGGWIRKSGNNFELHINKNGIVYNNILRKKLSSVKPDKLSDRLKRLNTWDKNFGTLDLETYKNELINKHCVYSIGFYVHSDGEANILYLNNDSHCSFEKQSEQLVVDCFKKMLINKYNKYVFYVHNFAKFDVYFIYKTLTNHPEAKEIFTLFPVFRGVDMISLEIKTNKKIRTAKEKQDERDEAYRNSFLKLNKFALENTERSNEIKIPSKKPVISKDSKSVQNYSIKIVDSYNILGTGLSKLSESFNTKIKKSVFPYNFVKNNTLFYKGDKPDISFYFHEEDREDKSNKDLYENIEKRNWDLKRECVEYLRRDLISLYLVMEEFSKYVKTEHNAFVTKCLTISSLAKNIFITNEYNTYRNIPLIDDKPIFRDISKSLFGGTTEVYKPFGKNLYYWDVNSLYPYASLNTMPGLECLSISNIDRDISMLDWKEFYGFYYCSIVAKEGYLGLLPVRLRNGEVIYPTGKFNGWYYSEELKFANEQGYEIHVISGYQFNRVENVFTKYVNKLYERKANAINEVDRTVAKSLLNNLIGRFGLDINKHKTSILDWKEYKYILTTRSVTNVHEIVPETKFIVSYNTIPDKEICEEHNIDILDVLRNEAKLNEKHLKDNNHKDVSVVITSAVNSNARIFMAKVKLDILKKGGKIYYTDTDSIVTDVELDNKHVGKNIGQFKLVHKVREGIFLSGKTYAIVTNKKDKDNNYITMCINKGSNTKLKYKDFESLYNKTKTRVDVGKFANRRNITEGYATAGKNDLVPFYMNSDAYKKRVKIENSDNKWIDTKPIDISNVETDMLIQDPYDT